MNEKNLYEKLCDDLNSGDGTGQCDKISYIKKVIKKYKYNKNELLTIKAEIPIETYIEVYDLFYNILGVGLIVSGLYFNASQVVGMLAMFGFFVIGYKFNKKISSNSQKYLKWNRYVQIVVDEMLNDIETKEKTQRRVCTSMME